MNAKLSVVKLCFVLSSFTFAANLYSQYIIPFPDYTAATFGYENTTNSIAIVDIVNPAPFRSGVDISMFIRTREESGFIFYFGSDLHFPQESYITGQLVKGNLVVNVTFDGKTERFQVYTVNLSDGNRHFIRVVRMNNSMMVKVNEILVSFVAKITEREENMMRVESGDDHDGNDGNDGSDRKTARTVKTVRKARKAGAASAAVP